MALRLPELIIIFVVALLIFGPKKLPEMGAQIGRGINAFRKGMSEFRNPLDDPLESDSFMTRHKEITRLEARRLELEILERELAVKKAEAELRATQAGIPPHTTVEANYVDSEATVDEDFVDSEATVDEDFAKSKTIVDADSPTPEAIAHTPVKPDKAAESEKETLAKSDKAAEPEKEPYAIPKVSAHAE
jgi:sec-independent protein translocase protein TatA